MVRLRGRVGGNVTSKTVSQTMFQMSSVTTLYIQEHRREGKPAVPGQTLNLAGWRHRANRLPVRPLL